MVVKIVTDSGADLPLELVKALNITVVPVYIYFGDKPYRDGIDISADELYTRLVEGPVHPTTTQPMPVDFVNVYNEMAREFDQIVSIHLSSKVSGTVNSALQARDMVNEKARIEIIDSQGVSMGLGLVTLAAARLARDGASLDQVVAKAKIAVEKTRLFGMLDTLKYLLAGGRITKAKAALGGILKVKPLLTMKNGELVQFGMKRNYQKGMEKLCNLIKGFDNIEEMAIVHSTVPDKAQELKKMIASYFPGEKIIMSRVGAGLGVHGGPGTLIIALRTE